MYPMVGACSDTAYAMEMLVKFVETPADTQQTALQKVFWYLIQSQILGLIFDRTRLATPTSYDDADWAKDQPNQNSLIGCVIMMTSCAVYWLASQRKVIALSSTEAEYILLCSCVKEII